MAAQPAAAQRPDLVSSSTSSIVSVPVPTRSAGSAGLVVPPSSETSGRYTENVEPMPGSLSTVTKPAACCTSPNTVDNPSPVPWTGPLVVKNGVKICARNSGRHAAPGVADRQPHELARDHAAVLRGKRFIHLHIVGRDGQRPAVRHGIPRVDDQVHEHLFDVTRIGLDAAQFRLLPQQELDVFAERAAQILSSRVTMSLRLTTASSVMPLRPKVSNWRVSSVAL